MAFRQRFRCQPVFEWEGSRKKKAPFQHRRQVLICQSSLGRGIVAPLREEISAKVHELTNLVTKQAQRRGEGSGMGHPELREKVIGRQTDLRKLIQSRLTDK